ncbi:MAG: cytochrome c-type biogenesis protein, partial [Trueperaceae bacterium]
LALAVIAGAALAQEVQLETRVFEIARQLRCPTCVSESVSDSSAPIAQQMREIIQTQLVEGRSDTEILAYFQTRYGDWILLDPPKRGVHLVAWLLPIIVGVLAIGVVALLARRWLANSRRPIEASPEELARVRRQLGTTSTQVEEPGTGGQN